MTSKSRSNGHGYSDVNAEFISQLKTWPNDGLRNVESSMKLLQLGTEKLTAISRKTWALTAEESTSYIELMMEIARANAACAAELASDLAGAKQPEDFVSVTTAHANRQMENIVSQNRKLWKAAQKIANVMAFPGEDLR